MLIILRISTSLRSGRNPTKVTKVSLRAKASLGKRAAGQSAGLAIVCGHSESDVVLIRDEGK